MLRQTALLLSTLLLLQTCQGKPYHYNGKKSHSRSSELSDSPFSPPIFDEDDDLFRDAKWMSWNPPREKPVIKEKVAEQAKAEQRDDLVVEEKVKAIKEEKGTVADVKAAKAEVDPKQARLDLLEKHDNLPQISDPCKKIYCKYGRICKANSMGQGVCVCGGDDYCQGHRKEVCGSDGVVYSSHCELHRMACVKNTHITIDHLAKSCKPIIKVKEAAALPLDLEHTQVKVNRLPLDPEAQKETVENQDEVLDSKNSVILDLQEEKPKETPLENVEELTAKEEPDSEEKIDEKDKEFTEVEKELDEKEEESPDENNVEKGDPDDVAEEAPSSEQEEVKTYETVTKLNIPCTDMEFERLKNNLLQYHCARIGEMECTEDPAKRQFVANIMFNYYDRNSDQMLTLAEMDDIEHRDHLDKLSRFCRLTNMLDFDDKEKDGNISLTEFYNGFMSTVLLEENLRVFTTMVTMGTSVELKCDIRGAREIIWKRNGATLAEITTDDIKVYEDGSLYINDLGLHHMGNYTCQDRFTDNVVQTHVLKVQMPPKVRVSPSTQFHTTGASVTLQCHADGVPEPQISWEMNESPLPEDPQEIHYVRLHNNATLEIKKATYTKDTGAYKCTAKNIAGTDQDIATVFIENSNVPKYAEVYEKYEVFVVFHDKGYTVYEPNHCHMEHQVTGSFNKFHTLPDYGDPMDTLCEPGQDCSWGSAVNVANRLIYISQPKLNRIIVIEIMERSNPIEVIPTDKVPVKMQYIEHLDQVWVLCWNKEDDSGEKTAMVIRQASQMGQHHTVHTQPLGNDFDLIQDLFLPPNNDLKHKFNYGYITHGNQQGLYKVDLHTMQYVKNIDLRDYQCVPKSVVYVPLGGKLVIHCVAAANEPVHSSRLVMDYVTDAVLEHTELGGEPYLSPDARYLVTVEDDGNTVSVSKLRDDGQMEHIFDEYTNLKISDISFFPSERGRGYDFYASSTNKNDVLFINLASGKVEMIEGVGQAMNPEDWPWTKHNRIIVSGGVFGQYLMTPSKDSVVVIDGKRRHVQCEWQNIAHGNVIVWVDPMHL